MTSSEQLDKWSAEMCGITFKDCYYGSKNIPHIYINGKYQVTIEYWRLSDARCREIVREHFKICSDYFDGCWNSWSRTGEFTATIGKGGTIEEAEISCVSAIMENE